MPKNENQTGKGLRSLARDPRGGDWTGRAGEQPSVIPGGVRPLFPFAGCVAMPARSRSTALLRCIVVVFQTILRHHRTV